MVLRNFQSGDDRPFLNLVNAAYRNLETLTTQRMTCRETPQNEIGSKVADTLNTNTELNTGVVK